MIRGPAGFVRTEIEVTGIAAHGSHAHLGVDASLKAGPVLTALQALHQSLADNVGNTATVVIEQTCFRILDATSRSPPTAYFIASC